MRAHIIENGVVVNTIEVESLDFMPNLVKATEGGIGWLYDGQTFSPPPSPSPVVPQFVSMRQARLALLQANLLDQVETTLSTISDPVEKQSALIEWEYATTVERKSPWVQTLSTALGLTEEQVDQLFIQASTL